MDLFRIGRLEQILKHKMLSNSTIKLDINDLLKRINYGMAKSSCELKSRLLEIEFELKNNSFIPVIFINKIGSILFDATGKENINGQIQKQILLIFNEFCHKYGATIIITNHLVNWLGISKPALGKIWIKGISKRIFLKREQNYFYLESQIDGKINGNYINYSLSEAGFIEKKLRMEHDYIAKIEELSEDV
ncbi:Rad51 domain-containing protein, partial [Meloidogyne graminicola]